jgi:hypothetical protein
MQIIIDWPDESPVPTAIDLSCSHKFAMRARRDALYRCYVLGYTLPTIADGLGVAHKTIVHWISTEVPKTERRGKGWRYVGEPLPPIEVAIGYLPPFSNQWRNGHKILI